MQFGTVLRLLRKRNNMTQRQLADTLGVSESRIGMYERCKREPDFEMLEAIADYFNVDMDYLTGRSDVERQYSFDPIASSPTPLTPAEQQLVSDYRSLNEEGQDKVSEYAADLVASGRYQKELSASAG